MVKLGLGGVQLGLPYGARSHLPTLSEPEAKAILHRAAELGFSLVDTAMAYGSSEERIGASQVLLKYPEFVVSTKPPLVEATVWRDSDAYFRFLKSEIAASKQKLKIPTLGLLQFHQCSPDFLTSAAVGETMQRLLQAGECLRIGVSVYTTEQADAALKLSAVSSLQVPIHLLDRRFSSPSFLVAVRNRRVELIARSIFYQGLLIESCEIPQVRPRNQLAEIKQEAVAIASSIGRTLTECAVGFIFGNLREALDIALLGANSVSELEEATGWVERAKPLSDAELEAFAPVNTKLIKEDLLDPAKWLL